MSDCLNCKGTDGRPNRCDNKEWYKESENPDYNYYGWVSTCQANLAPFNYLDSQKAELNKLGVTSNFCGNQPVKGGEKATRCHTKGVKPCTLSQVRLYSKGPNNRRKYNKNSISMIACCLDEYSKDSDITKYCAPGWCKENIGRSGTECNNMIKSTLVGSSYVGRLPILGHDINTGGSVCNNSNLTGVCDVAYLKFCSPTTKLFNNPDKVCLNKAKSRRGDIRWDKKMLEYCTQPGKSFSSECLDYYKEGNRLSNQTSWDNLYFDKCKSDSQITTNNCQDIGKHPNNQTKVSKWDPAMITYCNKSENRDKPICACLGQNESGNIIASQPLCFDKTCQNQGWVTDALEKNRNQQCSSVCQAIVSGETEVGSVNIEQIKINCSQQGVDVTDALAPKPPDSGNGSSPPTDNPPADDPPTDDPPIDDPPADDPSTEKKGSNLPLIIGVSVLGGLILLTIIGLLMFVMMS